MSCIGHSFGRKFVELLEDYAHTAVADHAQYIEFSGGNGPPGLLWEDAASSEHQSLP